jgi:inorganic pyrophosphatase
MRDITKLAHDLDRDAGTCRAIIETPKGGRCKYDFDPKTGLYRLKTLLPEGMSFPLDFGFIPSTLAEDGDPLDVMVLGEEPTPVGALVPVRLIGVLEAEEAEKGEIERNDRLLAVSCVSYLYATIRSAKELEPIFIEHLSDFWINKDKLEGKRFKVLAVREAPAAVALLLKAAKRAKRKA